jgi:hypothetical protein
MIQTLGMVIGIIMPFLMFLLIVRIIRRRSSQDISLVCGGRRVDLRDGDAASAFAVTGSCFADLWNRDSPR